MSSRPRYVFDTNTLVSALLFEGSKPGQAFFQALQRGEILVSASTLEELVEVLQREKFERYVTASEREEFVEAFVERATFIEPTEEVRICRDDKDDKFLELAVTGGAECIVTGDNDLLSLSPYRGIAIMTAAEFFEAIAGEP
ncbi:MAG: putative toxin-antitoxin system toxin component, PIN family [Deltaproteobacteria bacterium]|nr:putative toxin-antitoxin system toxin component, PIN family [Deltaproteobacteria bacterium]